MVIGHICEVLNGFKPVMLMVMLQIGQAGMAILYKLVANDGMNFRILVAYRMIFATAFTAPIAFILERKARPRLTYMILFQAFLCGLFGGLLPQNLFAESLGLTSPTLASAMLNLVPAFTFILAISFRLEKLELGTIAGKAKVLGTLTGIGGAFFLTFYKGAEINIWSAHVHLLHQNSEVVPPHDKDSGNRILGCFLGLAGSLSMALWFIIQTKMSKRYPCHYSSIALMCIMGSIQCVLFAIVMERDWKQWILGWNIRLLAASYSGIVNSGLVSVLIAWGVHVRGPLFVSIFSPVMLVVVALAGTLFMEEKLHLGSLIGAIFILCGLYMVLWGKSKEAKNITKLEVSRNAQESESVEIVVPSQHQMVP